MKLFKESWRRHPRYLADFGALFGAPPNLKCRGCARADYELFYGHCRACAKSKGIPMKPAEPQAFHDAMKNGGPAVVQGIPTQWYPWWHWRHWFGGTRD